MHVAGELVIDGKTLEHVLRTPQEPLLAQLGSQCGSVVICRASPSQKAAIVRMMAEFEVHTLLCSCNAATLLSYLLCCCYLSFLYLCGTQVCGLVSCWAVAATTCAADHTVQCPLLCCCHAICCILPAYADVFVSYMQASALASMPFRLDNRHSLLWLKMGLCPADD